MEKFTASLVLTPLLTFFVTISFWGLYKVADELENPFGQDQNDLPVYEVHNAYNDRLEEAWEKDRGYDLREQMKGNPVYAELFENGWRPWGAPNMIVGEARRGILSSQGMLLPDPNSSEAAGAHRSPTSPRQELPSGSSSPRRLQAWPSPRGQAAAVVCPCHERISQEIGKHVSVILDVLTGHSEMASRAIGELQQDIDGLNGELRNRDRWLRKELGRARNAVGAFRKLSLRTGLRDEDLWE